MVNFRGRRDDGGGKVDQRDQKVQTIIDEESKWSKLEILKYLFGTSSPISNNRNELSYSHINSYLFQSNIDYLNSSFGLLCIIAIFGNLRWGQETQPLPLPSSLEQEGQELPFILNSFHCRQFGSR